MRTNHTLLYLPHHQSSLSILYLVATIRTFILSFIILFLPSVIYSQLKVLGYSHSISLGILGVIYLFLPIFHILFTLPSSLLNARWGIKYGFLLGHIFFTLFLLVSSQAHHIHHMIWSFIIWGVASSFWWVAYHTFFIEVTNRNKIGKQISIMELFGILTGLLGPVIVGTLMMMFGSVIIYPIAFLSVLFLFGVSFFFQDQKKLFVVTPREIIMLIKNNKRDFISFFGAGAEEIIYSLPWSLFLYFIFKNYAMIGIFSAFVITCSILLSYVVGIFTDSFKKELIERVGIGAISSSWLLRALFQNPFLIFIADTLYKIFYSAFLIPFQSITYNHAQKTNINAYVVFREISYKLGNIFSISIFTLLMLFGVQLWYTFFIGAAVALLPLLIKEKKYG